MFPIPKIRSLISSSTPYTLIWDSEKVPQIDMGFLLGVPGYTWPVTTVTGLANQLVGMMYGGGLTYFDFKDDGTIGAG